METALYDSAEFAVRKFADYMNLESYVDYWFVYELTGNWEPNHPKSVYMHKDVNGKMTAGPVWDFDCGTYVEYTEDYNTSYTVDSAVYYDRLFQDAAFRQLVKQRWLKAKPKLEAVTTVIDSLEVLLASSNARNYAKYPIPISINWDEELPYEEAIARLKQNYLTKLNWMDSQIQQY
jgi:hypothetical protein